VKRSGSIVTTASVTPGSTKNRLWSNSGDTKAPLGR
jgi:hypothetical protein